VRISEATDRKKENAIALIRLAYAIMGNGMHSKGLPLSIDIFEFSQICLVFVKEAP
jgi:hypothetical protein